MHHDLKTASLGVLLRLVLVGVAFAMLWLDIAVYRTEILEVSFTEITQERVCAAARVQNPRRWLFCLPVDA
jgi:hypothetical protein